MSRSALRVAVLGSSLCGLLGTLMPVAGGETRNSEARSQTTSTVTAADGTTTTTITEKVTINGRTSTSTRTVVSRPGDAPPPEPPLPPPTPHRTMADERSDAPPIPPTPPAVPRRDPRDARAAEPHDSAALAREAVAAHNRVRRQHGVGDLTWEPKLAALAGQWAHHLCRGGKSPPMLQHRPAVSGGPGENLWEAVTTEDTRYAVSDAVSGWADEQKFYSERTGRCTGGTCGHYTQLVWSTTRQVGCAVATCPAGAFHATVWVCNYAPAGNFVNERPY